MTYGSDPYCSKCGKRITELADAVMDALALSCSTCVSKPLIVNATLTEIAEHVEQPGQVILDTQAAA